ncbi:MAG: UTP--glucose-1-phosphate uridylyltransferase [Thermodesulfobacteriota bacterium]
MVEIKKAIIPAAGWGTRLLPASKSIPKEMVPIVDKPGIQYIVEEAIASGIKEVVLVTAKGKGCIEDHFDIHQELENILAKKGKEELLTGIKEISRMVNIISVRQKVPLGTGDAVLCASQIAEGECVAVLFPDDLIDAEIPVTKQLMECYNRYDGGVIAIREVPGEDTHLYGIIEGEEIEDGLYRISTIVEKPSPGTSPSNLAVIGRYILPPEIFPILRKLPPSPDGEVQLAEGLVELSRRQSLYGYQFSGTRYDIGDKLGLVQASVGYALKRTDMRSRLTQWLDEMLRDER